MNRSALDFLRSAATRHGGKAAVLGKGPSFAEYDGRRDGEGRFVVGLNETALKVACHASFIIDEDILERSGDALFATGLQALITPRVLHRPTSRVGGLVIYGPQGGNEDAAWRRTFGDRWLAFNLDTAPADGSLGPVVGAGNFSAPVLCELLARAGFDDILLAGVDGGSRYSGAFADFEYKKLRSIQNDFDSQFKELRGVRDRHGVEFSSLRCRCASVLIGSEDEQRLCTEVLKWSIETQTFLSIRYVEAGSESRSLYTQGDTGTPFSLQRLFLPEMAGRRGRGVYFDSDMLVFKDVYELFNADMGQNLLMGCAATPGRPLQFSVFLVDNERANWDGAQLLARYRSGQVDYDWLMKQFAFASPKASTLPMAWNSLEVYEPNVTANVHFTDMGTQPWLSIYNPNADLWCEALFRAVSERPAVARALDESLAKGWVRPSLRWQVEHGRANPWTMPAEAKALDRGWLPPHQRLRFAGEPPRAQMLKWRLASRLRRLRQSRGYMRLLKVGHALRKIV